MEKARIRLDFIDIAKGIAIIMVVIGHAIRDEMRVDSFAYDYIYKVCYIFHMSFFFFLSGYTYKLSKNKYGAGTGQIAKRAKTMLLPWVLYSAFIYVVFEVAINLPFTSGILNGAGYTNLSPIKYLLCMLQANNPWSYHLWFIYVLFIISLIVILCDMIFKNNSKYVLIGLTIAFLAIQPFEITKNLGAWKTFVENITKCFPYFVLGSLVNLREIATKKWKIYQYIPAILAVGYVLVRAAFFAGREGSAISAPTELVKYTIMYLAYLLLPFAMFLVCKFSNYLSKFDEKIIVKYVKLFGKESFYIYLWHQPFCCAFLGLVIYNKMGLPAIVSVVISATLSFVVPFIIIWAKNKALKVIKK